MAAPAGAPPAAPPAGAPPAAPDAFPVAPPPAAQINLPGIGAVTQQPDGTYKAANGLIIRSDGNGHFTPDPTSLAQVTAAVKAQALPGGLTTQGETFSVNADGTLTITGRTDGKPTAAVGAVVQKNGLYTNADGSPYTGPGSGDPPGSAQMWAVRTPSGDPATDNPHFKGDNGGFVTDLVTKDNPIAGTYNAAVDLTHGQYKKAASDFGAGSSGGTLPQVDDKGNIVPGDTTKTVATEAGVPPDVPGVTSPVTGPGGIGDDLSKLVNGLKDIGGGGSSPIDTSATKADHDRAMALADALSGQANAAGAQADADRGLGTQTRAQQEDSIAGLTAAANGTAPSAAELQLKQQAGIDAARQYGLAAALQGNNPGAALRQASLGAAQVAGTTNQNAAINRANEQATARGQLATTLANVRSGDQGTVNTDVGQQTNLNSASGTASGQGVTSTGQALTAQTEKDKADAIKTGALVGAGGTLLSTILSDKRAKKNIAKASLADALGKEVHGVTFKYKPEVEEDDDPHFGILADALEKVIPGVVKKGPSGFKEVHTGHLALANVGVTAELARRLQDLEKGKGARRG